MSVNSYKRSAVAGLILTVIILMTSVAFSQANYTAQIRGTVTDSSGALVPNATITITNDATGIASTSKSDDRGQYILTGLRPATYTIKAEATGFRVVEQKNVILQVDQQTSINFTMNP